MKRIHSILATILVLASCTISNDLEVPSGIQTINSFSVSFENGTKAYIKDGGGVKWSERDSIMVFSNVQGPVKMYRDISDGRFKGNSIRGSEFYSYYPAANNSLISFDNSKNRNLLLYKNRGSFRSGEGGMEIPMVAKSQGDHLLFKQTCGMLHLSLSGSNQLLYVEMRGNNNEILSGDGFIDLSGDNPVFSIAERGSTVISVECPDSLSATGKWDIYFPVPEIEFSEGITLTVVCLDHNSGNIVKKTKTTTNRIQVQRADMYSLLPLNIDELSEASDSTNTIRLKDNVFSYGPDMTKSVRPIDESTIWVSSSIPSYLIPDTNGIIYFQPEQNGRNLFIGRVLSYERDGDGWLFKTETPAIEEVFSVFDVDLSFNPSDCSIEFEHDEEDTFTSCRIVDNSVWDDLDVICVDDSNTADALASNGLSRIVKTTVPIDITFEFVLTPSGSFTGKLYVRVTGTMRFSGFSKWEMDVETRYGFNGKLGVHFSGGKEIPLLSAKNGITLWGGADLLALKFKPSINFFCKGEIGLDAEMNYELMHSQLRVTYNSNQFSNESYDKQDRDTYFRVEAIRAKGEFGLNVKGDLYASLGLQELFKAGVSIRTGVSIVGEAGKIVFPEEDNFNTSVYFTPFIRFQPFVEYKTLSGIHSSSPIEFTLSTERFPVDLLPHRNIRYNMENTENDSAEVNVETELLKTQQPVIAYKSDGIALFEVGEDGPVEIKPILNESTMTPISFYVSTEKEYQIAHYVETYYNGFVYGERIPVKEYVKIELEIEADILEVDHVSPETLGIHMLVNLIRKEPKQYNGPSLYYQIYFVPFGTTNLNDYKPLTREGLLVYKYNDHHGYNGWFRFPSSEFKYDFSLFTAALDYCIVAVLDTPIEDSWGIVAPERIVLPLYFVYDSRPSFKITNVQESAVFTLYEEEEESGYGHWEALVDWDEVVTGALFIKEVQVNTFSPYTRPPYVSTSSTDGTTHVQWGSWVLAPYNNTTKSHHPPIDVCRATYGWPVAVYTVILKNGEELTTVSVGGE